MQQRCMAMFDGRLRTAQQQGHEGGSNMLQALSQPTAQACASPVGPHRVIVQRVHGQLLTVQEDGLCHNGPAHSHAGAGTQRTQGCVRSWICRNTTTWGMLPCRRALPSAGPHGATCAAFQGMCRCWGGRGAVQAEVHGAGGEAGGGPKADGCTHPGVTTCRLVRSRPRCLSTMKPVAYADVAASVSNARVWVTLRVGAHAAHSSTRSQRARRHCTLLCALPCHARPPTVPAMARCSL